MLFNGIEYETDDLKRLMALGDHNTASMLFDAWPKPDDGFEALALAALGEPASWMGADADEWLRAGATRGRDARARRTRWDAACGFWRSRTATPAAASR